MIQAEVVRQHSNWVFGVDSLSVGGARLTNNAQLGKLRVSKPVGFSYLQGRYAASDFPDGAYGR